MRKIPSLEVNVQQDQTSTSEEIFSFHLLKLPFLDGSRHLISAPANVPGLLHPEMFYTMNLGTPIVSASRYNLNSFGLFAWWASDAHLENFLAEGSYPFSDRGWHVRMKLYRRWGEIAEIADAKLQSVAHNDQPIVAVTLARLNLSQTARFIKFGKPVERQVRDHSGQGLALAAIRPLKTFSTFSIWKTEAEMINMVHGKSDADGKSHADAMRERTRKDFHSQFTTMRFVPYKEVGEWNGKSNFTAMAPIVQN